MQIHKQKTQAIIDALLMLYEADRLIYWTKLNILMLGLSIKTDKTNRVPRAKSKTKNGLNSVFKPFFLLAGAEGFEPSARGFGDRCSTN